MANDFRLQCIRISISALSKYDRIKNIKENKRGKEYLYRVVCKPVTNVPPATSGWRRTFVRGRDSPLPGI
jgi:hypothetical protein